MILNFTAVRQLHCRYYDNFTPTNVGTSFEFVLNAEISDFGYSLREAEIHAEPTAWQFPPPTAELRLIKSGRLYLA